MLTKEINQEVVDALKLLAPIYLYEHEKWKRLYWELTKSVREIKRISLLDFKRHVMKLMFDIKRNKFRLDAEHVRRICFPYLITLLQFKVAVRNNPDFVSIPEEKLARQKVVIRYMVRKDFNQELWDDMHKIAEHNADEYYVINIRNPQYGLTSKEQVILNRLVYRGKPKSLKKDPLVCNTNKWLSKKVPTVLCTASSSDDVQEDSPGNAQIGSIQCPSVNRESIENKRLKLNNPSTDSEQLDAVCEECTETSDGNKNDKIISKVREQSATITSVSIETELRDILGLNENLPMGAKRADAVHELSSESEGEFTIPYSLYDNLSADSDSETDSDGCKDLSPNQGVSIKLEGRIKDRFKQKTSEEAVLVKDSDDSDDCR